jgi:hypothetical protein
VAVRQGSFTDRSPTRWLAVNEGVSGLVVAQHRSRASGCPPGPYIRDGRSAGSPTAPPDSRWPGDRAEGGCVEPHPLVSSACRASDRTQQPAAAYRRRSIALCVTHIRTRIEPRGCKLALESTFCCLTWVVEQGPQSFGPTEAHLSSRGQFGRKVQRQPQPNRRGLMCDICREVRCRYCLGAVTAWLCRSGHAFDIEGGSR